MPRGFRVSLTENRACRIAFRTTPWIIQDVIESRHGKRLFLRQVGCSSCMYKIFSVSVLFVIQLGSHHEELASTGEAPRFGFQGEKVHQSACKSLMISSSVCWSGTLFICHFPPSTSMYCSLLPIRGLASPIATFALISSSMYVSRSSCFPSNSLC